MLVHVMIHVEKKMYMNKLYMYVYLHEMLQLQCILQNATKGYFN